MPAETPPDQSLHLPSLVIKNFRGIDELTIPRLGRVTLLAGKNGVGKTTVLDAVRIWADRGLFNVFDTVLEQRGDAFTTIEGSETRIVVDRTALFTNRPDSVDAVFSVGCENGDSTLRFRQRAPSEQLIRNSRSPMSVLGSIPLEMQFGKDSRGSTTNGYYQGTRPDPVTCNTLGPHGPDDETVEQYWSEVALTSHEDRALEALNLITDSEVERVAALSPPASDGMIQPRRMMAKVRGTDYQVALRSLGDGALRTYAVALALAKSTNGFLLIDEVENGIHHSVQTKFWEMVLKTAQRNNVQVIATTHSSDCAYRFGQVASELPDIEGILYRIQRNVERLRAVPYPEDQLVIAAEHRIEVR